MKVHPIKIPAKWMELLGSELKMPYFKDLSIKIRKEYLENAVFPHPSNLFRAFEFCHPSDIKVVILGQDPYHTPGVAHGLAFSTLSHNPIPPSLRNIFKEIEAEFGKKVDPNPDLSRWAKQGVLLLNASLTVKPGVANSHAQYGWHQFTDAVIKELSEKENHIVFMLWGAFAGKKQILIDDSKHLVLMSVHPSPLSAYRGFFGNNHFKLANEYLRKKGRGEIEWK